MHSKTLALAFATALALAPAPLSAQTAARAPVPGISSSDMARVAAMPAVADNPGHGAFKVDYEPAPAPLRAVVYRPIDIAAAASKKKLGVYVWGNGGCGADATMARVHLAEIASAGFVVVAPGEILTGAKAKPAPAGAPPRPGVTVADMQAALNWILAENDRAGSPYHKKLDLNRVAIGGNSCGGLLAVKTGLDPRVKSVSVQNGGVWPSKTLTGPGMPRPEQLASLNAIATEADLLNMHTPIFIIIGGEEDIAHPPVLATFQIARAPMFVADHPGGGHFGVFMEPNNNAGTWAEIDWLKWQLDKDPTAAKTFVGKDCKLCVDPKWKVHKKGID